MNQFRDILILLMLILAAALGFGHPDTWTWAERGGAYAVDAVRILGDTRPWSILILCALALALFITRIKY